MPDLLSVLTSLAWPLAIALAWLAGEFGQRWTGLPRISFYGVVGFALAQLADRRAAAAGCRAGRAAGRRRLRPDPVRARLPHQPALAAQQPVDRRRPGWSNRLLTFVAVYLVAIAFGAAPMTALLLASLSMSTSPATVVRVINEQNSSGQVTERVLHLTALNCVLAVFAFNVIVGFWMFRTLGRRWRGSVATAWSCSPRRSWPAPCSAWSCRRCCARSAMRSRTPPSPLRWP